MEGSDAGVVHFCRSRSKGRRCTRPLGHVGLHRHRTIMWTESGADALRCAGSGEPGEPAAPLADGYPHGRALCPVCLRFVPLDDAGALVEHDTTDAAETGAEARRRGEWFNAHGW
ncbi:hypothetical protein [Microbacterium sp. CPCC 204701]|uniref:hypothetical protein n=1 Tax=Microbacterium sp. CPCC 204701 TaxID=2493084 RepID=UPI000FDAA01C|nr:hypothetical protein [Microbacterium sp. CPCC 204701]